MAVKHKPVDVVTVGAGWTAAMLAAKLCPDGHEHGLARAGPGAVDVPAFRPRPRQPPLLGPLRPDGRPASARRGRGGPNPTSPALPMRQYGSFNPGMGLGGAAVHWSAQLWRYLETDFRYRSHVVERYGEQKIPAGCTVQDWGITYDELEPYYDAFEWDIGASGQAGNIHGQEDSRRKSVRVAALPRLPESAARRSRRTARTSPPPASRSACTRSRSRPGSSPARGPTRTGITAAAASTAGSAPASAARSTRRRARSTRTCRLR